MPDLAFALSQWVESTRAGMRSAAIEHFVRTIEVFAENCPVKTGRTLNSFVATLNEPAANTDPGPGEYDKTGAAVVAQARAIAESATVGDTIYFTSDYPGATLAEEGNRHLPPRRMVMAAANQWGDE